MCSQVASNATPLRCTKRTWILDQRFCGGFEQICRNGRTSSSEDEVNHVASAYLPCVQYVQSGYEYDKTNCTAGVTGRGIPLGARSTYLRIDSLDYLGTEGVVISEANHLHVSGIFTLASKPAVLLIESRRLK